VGGVAVTGALLVAICLVTLVFLPGSRRAIPAPLETSAAILLDNTPVATANIAPVLPLVSDDFADESASSLLSGGDTETRYAFEDGSYTITITGTEQLVWSRLSGTFDNTALAVDATMVAGPPTAAAAIVFRFQDNDNFYIFNVRGGAYNLQVRKNGIWRVLIDWTPALRIRSAGETNRLRVETVGDTITLFANDEQLGQMRDSTFSSGRMALSLNTFEIGGARVAFDNLSVEQR
jgi:hypothetical protein